MNEANRDLLLLDTERLSPEEFQREVKLLNAMLFHIENWQSFSVANELIDINRRRIIRKAFVIQQVLSEKKIKPFVFVSSKN